MAAADTPVAPLLLHLPNELVTSIVLHLQPRDLCSLELCCRRLLELSRGDEALWQALAEDRWGPLRKTRLWPDWRSVLIYLETTVRSKMRQSSVRGAFELMAGQALLERAGAWTACAHRLLTWTTLPERRRLAAFVCADWQPRKSLRAFLQLFDLRAPTPEVALRQLLFRFPFLPIDAGSGADRVIGEFARQYVLTNPRAVHDMRLGGAGEEPQSTSDESDGGAEDKYAGVDKAARDGVYALLYSVIMLNTDLNNPAIEPKIQLPEYIASCKRCVPLRDVPDAYLRQVYTSILRAPLRISPTIAGVKSIVRSAPEEETESGPSVSVYSSLPPEATPTLDLSDDEIAAAVAAATRARAGPPQRIVSSLTLADLKVAYWNLIDLYRWYRWRAAEAVAAAAQRRTAAAASCAALVVVAAVLLHVALSSPRMRIAA